MEIKLKLLRKEDTKDLFNLIQRNRENFRPYFPITVAEVKDMASCRRYVEEKISQCYYKEHYFFTITKDKIIGSVMLKNLEWNVCKGELAYFIDKECEGAGYTSLAVKQAVNYIFRELGLEKIFLKVAPGNPASKKIALKNGFKKEGVLRQDYLTGDGKIIDVEYYGLLKNEWL